MAPENTSSIEEVMKAMSFISLWNEKSDPEKLNGYIFYLSYRVQRALYEIMQEEYGDFPWESFRIVMAYCEQVRKAADAVAFQVVKNIPVRAGFFRFGIEDTPLFFDDDIADAENDNTRVTCTKVFDSMRGYFFLQVITFKAEIDYYQRQIELGKKSFWEEYLEELKESETMRTEVSLSIRDALVRLDFREAWESREDLEELIDKLEETAWSLSEEGEEEGQDEG